MERQRMSGRLILKTSMTISMLLLYMTFTAAGKIIYVDDNAPGNNKGSTWAKAYNDLQDALTDANSSSKPVQIHVAQGTYKPDQGDGITPGDRTATFQLINGVIIKGGYAGFEEPDPDARDIELYDTVLSGDLAGNDVEVTNPRDLLDEPTRTENSYHVITGSETTNETTVLDGFIVTGGNANWDPRSPYYFWKRGGGMSCTGSPTVTNCTFLANTACWGGGMCIWSGSPTLANCTFRANATDHHAGALEVDETYVIITNCSFIGNFAAWNGGAVWNFDAAPPYINCVFSGNVALGDGGAIWNVDSGGYRFINCTFINNTAGRQAGAIDSDYWPMLTNCIFWGNRDNSGMGESAHVHAYTLEPFVFNYCCVQGWTGDLGGIGNTGDDPLFVEADGADNVPGTEDDNLRLLAGSACLDAGDNSALPPSVLTDLDGNPRIVNGTVDMGAYEGLNQGFLLSTSSVSVPEGATSEFSVTLAMNPAGTVEAIVAHESGDTDITVMSPSLLIFDSSNYLEPQVVTVAAAQDTDYLYGKALIFISAAGFPTAGVTVTELDDEAPTVLYVDSSAPGASDGSFWTDAFTCLQDALRVAKTVPEVQEIRVAQGIYKPDQGIGFTPGDQKATFKLLNGLAIKGGYAGFAEPAPDARDINLYETILSGDLNGDDIEITDPCDLFAEPSRAENSWHVVTSQQYTNETAVLDGFTITCGNANEPYLDYSRGGGMYSSWMSTPVLKNCTFVANSSRYDGGGMYNYNSSPILTNCTFSRNSTTGEHTASGGGMCNSYSSPILSGCTFSGNSASLRGGGMHNEGDSNPTLVNCIFSGNSTYSEWGGGGGMTASFRTISTVTNCLFSGNSARGNSGCGGAIYNVSYRPVLLNNCIFSGNYAGQAGGGLYNSDYGDVTMNNCTFSENSAQYGNALACGLSHSPGKIRVNNSIIWDGGNEIWNNNSTIAVTYSDIHNGWPGVGNIDADPLFADPNNGDYHLESQAGRWEPDSQSWVQDDVTSPCIDTGDPVSPIGLEPFPNGGLINMGAYGSTARASKSYFGGPVCEIIVAGDVNGDCKVNFLDFRFMALNWLKDNSKSQY